MTTALYKILPWDSDFLGYNVFWVDGNAITATSLEQTLRQLKGQARLVYLALPTEFGNADLLQRYHGRLVDVKTTYAKNTSAQAVFSPAVGFYESTTASEMLISLGIASGIYSRFNTDPEIGRNKYEALYREWVINSVNRRLAKDILVFREGSTIAGMVTLGEKQQRADIGLVAVDASFRGKGIGLTLMEAAENQAYHQGYMEIQVVTQRNNIPACKLYEKSGYKIVKEEYFYHFWL